MNYPRTKNHKIFELFFKNMPTEEQILFWIKQVQEKNDKEAQKQLLAVFYKNGCKWAQKYLSSRIYSDLITSEISEVNSCVYISFIKAVKTYRIEKAGALSFKNYFYQMIKYQTYSDMKRFFNWRVITNYKDLKASYIRERKRGERFQEEYVSKLDVERKCEIIYEFLLRKGKCYAEIFKLKSNGYKGSQICEELNISPMVLKAKMQCIRKLILRRYQSLENIS